MVEVDVAVVGAGPAGLAAGIHLARAGIRHVVVERAFPGGLLHAAGLVECYPGFPHGVQGPRLALAMERQARRLEVALERAEVDGAERCCGGFAFRAGARGWAARCAILATGTRPVPVVLPAGLPPGRVHRGTDSFRGAPGGARVWISGGGDAAFDSALQLAGWGARVDLSFRGAAPRALGRLVERAQAAGVRVHAGCALLGVEAAGEGLAVWTSGGAAEVDHLVLCHGREPEDALWRALAGDAPLAGVLTAIPSLFLAGDVCRGAVRYAAVAAGDGLRAARLAESFLGR